MDRALVMMRDPHRAGVEVQAIIERGRLTRTILVAPTVPRFTVKTRPPGRTRASITRQS
jgi:hypothetical protein